MKNNFRRQQHGTSLVELMVSLTIGLALVLVLSYFFLGSRQVGRTNDDASRMQENARYALDVLGRSIRQAGYRENLFVAFSASPLSGVDGANAATPDSITVRFDAQTGGERDCSGTLVTSATLAMTFTVNANKEFTCDNGSGAVVLAENIENLKIGYGIDSDRDGVIDENRTAAGTDFGLVALVRITLTAVGGSKSAADGDYPRQVYSTSFTVRNQAG